MFFVEGRAVLHEVLEQRLRGAQDQLKSWLLVSEGVLHLLQQIDVHRFSFVREREAKLDQLVDSFLISLAQNFVLTVDVNSEYQIQNCLEELYEILVLLQVFLEVHRCFLQNCLQLLYCLLGRDLLVRLVQ